MLWNENSWWRVSKITKHVLRKLFISYYLSSANKFASEQYNISFSWNKPPHDLSDDNGITWTRCFESQYIIQLSRKKKSCFKSIRTRLLISCFALTLQPSKRSCKNIPVFINKFHTVWFRQFGAPIYLHLVEEWRGTWMEEPKKWDEVNRQQWFSNLGSSFVQTKAKQKDHWKWEVRNFLT